MLPLMERMEVVAWRDGPAADPAERWAAGAVRAIEEQIERPDFEFRTDHPRLLLAEVQYARARSRRGSEQLPQRPPLGQPANRDCQEGSN